MALLSKAIKDKEFDTRTVERSLTKGWMTQGQVEKHQTTLADEAELGDYLNVEELFQGIEGKSPLRSSH